MGFWSEYSVFLAQAVTVVLAIIVVVGFIAAVGQKNKKEGRIEIKKLNDKIEDTKDLFEHELLSKEELKEKHKALKKEEKEQKKAKKKEAKSPEASEAVRKKRVFVLDFDGDINASAVDSMRDGSREIRANRSRPNPESAGATHTGPISTTWMYSLCPISGSTRGTQPGIWPSTRFLSP